MWQQNAHTENTQLALAPKGSPEFCGTLGVLQEGSAERTFHIVEAC